MAFLKCKDCIVRSCCGAVCEDFKKYCKKKFNITIGNNISLEHAEAALGDITEVEKNITQNLEGLNRGYKIRRIQ